MSLLKFCVSALLIHFSHSVAAGEITPPKQGNFCLPGTQQPGPLVSFGQHVIDKNLFQFFFLVDDYVGKNKHFVDLVPGIVYGITDSFSAFLNIPIAAAFKQDDAHSSGFEDMNLTFEYAFYNKKSKTNTDQATLVGTFFFPTGSLHKQPPTGFGAMHYFVGATYNKTYLEWFAFASPGVLLTTQKDNDKIGNEFLYQLGIGRNIKSNPDKYIIAGLVEVTGTYAEKNKVNGSTDPNSGGNVVYVTPSLWVSTPKLIFQLGAGWAATQHLFGNQKREHYLLITNFGWTFS